MTWRLHLLACILLLGLGSHGAGHAQGAPQRIVSGNQCTDRLLAALVDAGRIAALSRLAGDVLPDLPRIAGSVESILEQSPDLVLLGPEGQGRKGDILRGFGVQVLAVDIPESIAAQRDLTLRLGLALGAGEKAEKLAGLLPQEVQPISEQAPTALWLAPRLYAFGPASLAGDVLAAAGWRNALGPDAPGWTSLSLERVLAQPADLLVTEGSDGLSWAEALLDHPALAHLSGARVRLEGEGERISCDPVATARVIDMLRGLRTPGSAARRGGAAG